MREQFSSSSRAAGAILEKEIDGEREQGFFAKWETRLASWIALTRQPRGRPRGLLLAKFHRKLASAKLVGLGPDNETGIERRRLRGEGHVDVLCSLADREPRAEGRVGTKRKGHRNSLT